MLRGILHWKDANFLQTLLTKLTENFEADPHSPSLVSKMDEAYVHDMMKAIIAFEIEVTSVEHVFKLSQNRNEKSYENIIEHLQDGDADAKTIAETMKEKKDYVFRK